MHGCFLCSFFSHNIYLEVVVHFLHQRGHQLCHFLLIFACLECVVMTNVCLLTILKQEPFSTCSSFIVLVSRIQISQTTEQQCLISPQLLRYKISTLKQKEKRARAKISPIAYIHQDIVKMILFQYYTFLYYFGFLLIIRSCY